MESIYDSGIEKAQPFTTSAIDARLQTRVIGRHLEIHDEIDSTNTRAVILARQGAPEGTIVLAEHQTQGRGRLNRRWFAPPRSALLLSMVLRPLLPPHRAQYVTMICALAVVEAIERTTGLDARIKWPNDIVLGEKKMGGILTELELHGSQLAFVVVGLGLNINVNPADLLDAMEVQPPAKGSDWTWHWLPTSLSAEAGRNVSRLDLLIVFLEEFETRYEQLARGWTPLPAWRERLVTLGQVVRASSSEETIEGFAHDVDEDGALLIRCTDGTLRRVLAGDVTLRGQASASCA